MVENIRTSRSLSLVLVNMSYAVAQDLNRPRMIELDADPFSMTSLIVEQQPIRARMCGFGDKVGLESYLLLLLPYRSH